MLIRQTLSYLPAQLFGPLIQFATAIILTHLLDASEYGLTMLIFANQELIYVACLAWWPIYMLRYAGSMTSEADRQRFADTERGAVLVTALLQLVATGLSIAIVAPHASVSLMAGAFVFTLSRSYLNFLGERARNLEAVPAYTIVQVGAPLAGLVLTIGLAKEVNLHPNLVLLAFGGMQGLVALFVAWRLGIMGGKVAFDRQLLRDAFAFGIPVVISNVLGWITLNGIRFVIQAIAGIAALGLFSVGWGLASRLATVAAMLVTAAAYPLAVKAMEAGDPDAARKQLSDNSALLLALIAPATFGIIAINEPLTNLLIATEFRETTIAILPWALAGAAIRSLRMHGWDQMYLLFRALRPMLVLGSAEVAVTLAGTLVGALLGGVLGAVIGNTIATAIVAVADYTFLSRRLGLKAPFWLFIRILAASGIMFFAVRMLPRLGFPIQAEWLHLAGAVFWGGLVYALVLPLLLFDKIRPLVASLRQRFARA